MGRFFKATPTSFLDDAMYEHPTDLMQKALMTKEKSAQDRLTLLEGVDDNLEVDPHSKDRDRTIEIKNRIEQQKEDLIQDFYENPDMDATRRSKVMGLQKEIKNQMSVGEIAQFNKNNKFIKRREKELGKKYDEDPSKYRAFASKQQMIDYYNSTYKGGVDEDGNLLSPTDMSLAESDDTMTDVKKAFSNKVGKDLTKDIPFKNFTKRIETEGFEKGEIENTITDYINSSDKVQRAIIQEMDVINSDAVNEEDRVTYEQVRQKYSSRLKSTALDQFGKVKTSEKLIGRGTGGSGSPENKPDGDFTSQGVVVKKRNETFTNAIESVRADPDMEFSEENVKNVTVSNMKSEIGNYQKQIRRDFNKRFGEELSQGDLFNEKTGALTQNARNIIGQATGLQENAEGNKVSKFTDPEQILKKYRTAGKRSHVQKLMADNFEKKTPEFFKNSISAIEEAETQLQAKKEELKPFEGVKDKDLSDEELEKKERLQREVTELGNEKSRQEKIIEAESSTSFLVGEELNGSNFKNFWNDKDSYQSREVLIPETGFMSHAGEAGNFLNLAQALENIRRTRPEEFRNTVQTYEVTSTKRKEGGKKIYMFDGKETTFNKPIILESGTGSKKTTIIEAAEMEMDEKNWVSANPVLGQEYAVHSGMNLGKKHIPLLLKGDGLVTDQAKQTIQKERQVYEGFNDLKDIIHGTVVDEQGYVNPQLRGMEGKLEDLSIKINDKGKLVYGDKEINGRQATVDILNEFMLGNNSGFTESDE